MKIKPLEDFVGNDIAYSYVGIRADEQRAGYISTHKNIKPIYIYKEKDFANYKFNKVQYNQKETIKEFQKLGIDLPIKKQGYALQDVQKILV